MKPTDFSYALSKYLSVYLPGQYNASPHTILAYRDTFKLLLRYAEDKRKTTPERLTLAMIDKTFVYDFLSWLESNGNGISTRNQRLAAVRAFFRYLQWERPDMLACCQEILSIPLKRAEKATIDYLSVEAVKALLAAPDASDKYGLRDRTMLCLLYDSGARVSELASLSPSNLRLDSSPIVTMLRKRRKKCQCPLSPAVVEHLRHYLSVWKLDSPEKSAEPLFTNHEGERIGRAGVAYILQKYSDMVRCDNPALIPQSVSPHMIRHSRAMHLLQAGVNLIYIRDWLGHESVKTTEIYARADSEMKRSAIQKAAAAAMPMQSSQNLWADDSELLEWLNSLGK